MIGLVFCACSARFGSIFRVHDVPCRLLVGDAEPVTLWAWSSQHNKHDFHITSRVRFQSAEAFATLSSKPGLLNETAHRGRLGSCRITRVRKGGEAG